MGSISVSSKQDKQIVMNAAQICDVEHLCGRMMSTLRGGELQRVFLAGAVAQNTPILLLDEPTTFLDPAHEKLFLNALSRVRDNQDLTIIMVTHDINIALSFCTHVCGINNGCVAFSGDSVAFRNACPSILQDLYGIPFAKYTSAENNCQVFGAWGQNA